MHNELYTRVTSTVCCPHSTYQRVYYDDEQACIAFIFGLYRKQLQATTHFNGLKPIQVAQWLECWTSNRQVARSNPLADKVKICYCK